MIGQKMYRVIFFFDKTIQGQDSCSIEFANAKDYQAQVIVPLTMGHFFFQDRNGELVLLQASNILYAAELKVALGEL